MPVVSSTSFVPDLCTENACPGTLAMDAACYDRDWILARTGSVSPAVSGGWVAGLRQAGGSLPARQSAMGSQISSATSMTRSGPD
jgi:hypothetical protein